MDSDATVGPASVAGPIRLEPFHGLTLAPARVGDPASARAFARPYQEVPARLRQWERRRFLTRDADPAVYLHEYTAGGLTIRGLVGSLDVSSRTTGPDRPLWAHEGIHPAQAAELANRMAAMELNPAPILLVHRGRAEVRDLLDRVAAREPHQVFTDKVGHRNRLWTVRSAEDLAVLDRGLRDARVLIADGHHRYAAYLRMQEKAPGTPADRGLVMLVDQTDTPLFLGAIHRVLTGTNLDEVEAAAAGWATTERVARGVALDALAHDTMLATDGDAWVAIRAQVPPDRALVEILHDELVPRLGHDRRRIEYRHSVEDALAGLPASGTAVLLPAPDFDQVLRTVASGRLLPEKATSFQPKPSLGALMRSLRDESASPS